MKLSEFIDFERLIAMMPGHVYWLDRRNVYQGCNDRQARAYGLASRDKVIGLTNHDMPTIEASIADIWNQNNLEVMETGIAKLTEEPSVLEDGKQAVVLSNKVPIFDKQQKVIGLLGISLVVPA